MAISKKTPATSFGEAFIAKQSKAKNKNKNKNPYNQDKKITHRQIGKDLDKGTALLSFLDITNAFQLTETFNDNEPSKIRHDKKDKLLLKQKQLTGYWVGVTSPWKGEPSFSGME